MSKPSYEVHVLRDGRWRIEATFDDQEAAELSARAEIVARGAEEVKVLKYRPFVGFEVELCVFHRKAPEGKDGAMLLGGGADGAPVCRKADDLAAFDARLVAGRLLRVFLEKHRITFTELLHGWGYARRLEEQGNLLRAAVAAVARRQAETLGVDAGERTRALLGFADEILLRLRTYNGDRKTLPPLDWDDPARSRRLLIHAAGEADGEFFFLARLTDRLQSDGSLLAKLETLLDPWEEAPDDRTAALLERFIADALGSVETLRELLGPQPNLAAGLAAMADLLVGRPPAADTAPVNPLLSRIGARAARGAAPECRAMLVERIRASLAGEQPLDRRNPAGEPVLIGMLEQRLLGPDGKILGGAETARALTRRAVRRRQSLLRNMGMHDVADAAGAQRLRDAGRNGGSADEP